LVVTGLAVGSAGLCVIPERKRPCPGKPDHKTTPFGCGAYSPNGRVRQGKARRASDDRPIGRRIDRKRWLTRISHPIGFDLLPHQVAQMGKLFVLRHLFP
jgi:hypothetical protein